MAGGEIATRAALVLVSHDRRFLQDLTRATVWLDRGRTASTAVSRIRGLAGPQLEEEERRGTRLGRKIVAEEHWLRYGVSGRRKRNIGGMGDLTKCGPKRRQRVAPTSEIRLEASEAQLSGKLVIEAVKIGKSYGERVIVEDFSTRVMRGDRLGIIGANGAGKTTLVNLLTGKLAPDAGKVRLGAGLAMATLEQSRASLDPASTLQDALTGGGSDFVEINGERQHIIGYMRDFLFGPEQARTPVGKLSGGERGRLMLARALALPSNVLVLDEPTNDLDLETLDLIGGNAGRLSRHADRRQPRPRFSRSRGDLGADGRGRGPVAGICRRIFGYGGATGGGGRSRREAAPAPSRDAEKAPPREKPAGRPRLSNKEKHALTTLPKKMDELRAKKAKLQALLDDPDLYTSDPTKFARAGPCSPRSRRSWPARRRNGWNWKSGARKSRGDVVIPRPAANNRRETRHCERSEAIQGPPVTSGLLRRFVLAMTGVVLDAFGERFETALRLHDGQQAQWHDLHWRYVQSGPARVHPSRRITARLHAALWLQDAGLL